MDPIEPIPLDAIRDAQTALSGPAGTGKIVCVISGGNIDPVKIATILRGEIPKYGTDSVHT